MRKAGITFKRVQNQDGERFRRVVASPDPCASRRSGWSKDLFERGVIVIARAGGNR